MKNISLLTLLLALILGSCSKNEDPIVVTGPAISLTLTSDVGSQALEVLSVNEEVNFTLTGSDSTDYTSSAKYYVNDVEIPNNSYTFTTKGTYDVKAVYQDITSNVLNFEVIGIGERVLTVDFPKALRNQTITFGLLDSDGNNTATEATFYINGESISGNTYTSANPGEFEVYASYILDGETLNSEVKNIEVFIPKRKVVIEDYTGTWCGYCPKVILAIEDVETVTDNITVVAIHKKAGSLPEPMDFPQILELQAEFGVGNGFPKAQLNRTVAWNEPFLKEEVTSMAGSDTNVSIGIASQLTGSNISVEVKVIYENGSEVGDKLVVYLVESGIVSAQANYFNHVDGHPYEGLGDPIVDYVHNDALRKSISGLFGDNIPETPAFQEYKKNYTVAIPPEYNPENLSFVVMVVKEDNNAKNSQHAELSENKNYE